MIQYWKYYNFEYKYLVKSNTCKQFSKSYILSVHIVSVPEVCYNDIFDMSDNENGTVSYQGRFFCPIDENMSEDYRYCCGEEGQQNCCTFWDKQVKTHIKKLFLSSIFFSFFFLFFLVLDISKLLGVTLIFFLYFRPGHIVGVVFGIIASVVALFIAVFCVVKCIKTNKSRNCKLLIFSSTLKYPPFFLSQYK